MVATETDPRDEVGGDARGQRREQPAQRGGAGAEGAHAAVQDGQGEEDAEEQDEQVVATGQQVGERDQDGVAEGHRPALGQVHVEEQGDSGHHRERGELHAVEAAEDGEDRHDQQSARDALAEDAPFQRLPAQADVHAWTASGFSRSPRPADPTPTTGGATLKSVVSCS